ncbi:MAG: Tetratricopeptide repeat [Euryarchaeota archaeon]|nr:Tetratricopeptide repeat [Euryarchaeota archaeon]
MERSYHVSSYGMQLLDRPEGSLKHVTQCISEGSMDKFEAIITIILGLAVSIIGSWIYIDKSKNVFKNLLIILCVVSVLLIVIILPGNHQTGRDKELTNIQAALNNKGYLLYTEGKFKEAIIYYEKALEKDPEYKLAKNNKIDALRRIYSVAS